MPKFCVSYSMDELFEIDVEAENAEEAKRMVNDDEVDFSKADHRDSQFLHVNTVEEIEE